MKKNNYPRCPYLYVILCMVWSATIPSKLSAQLSVNTVISPPYPTDVDYYLDDLSNLYVSIINTDLSRSFTYRLSAEITGPGGISGRVNYQGDYFTINPGQSTFFNGLQLRDLGMQSEDIRYSSSLTPQQERAILLNRVLPEGNYTICIFAYDQDDNLISSPSEGCADFYIQYLERPEIIIPQDGAYVDGVLNVMWFQDVSALQPADRMRLQYRLNIVDDTQNELYLYIEELYNLNVTGIMSFETSIQTLTLQNGVDLNLLRGHRYIAWVTTIDPEGRIIIADRGNSPIIRFNYGSPEDFEEDEDDDSDNFGGCVDMIQETYSCSDPFAELYFPSDRDTIPYAFMPFMLRFDPYCAEYRRLNYEFELHHQGTGSRVYSRNDELRWGAGGPLQYLRDRGIIDANEDRARYFMMNDSWRSPGLQRAQTYRATAQAGMRMSNGNQFNYDLQNSFVVGMPQPGLELPNQNDSIPPGDIGFRWDNGALPLNSFPDVFHLLRMHGRTVEDMTFYGPVSERWVLQISRSNQFRNEDMFKGASEAVAAENFMSVEDLMTSVYRINNQSFNITDEGTFYWRVVWLLNPDMPVPENFYVRPEDMYHVSEIRRFTVKTGVTPAPAPDEETPRSECSAPCTFPAISDRTAVGGLARGAVFTAAGFRIEVKEISGSGTTFSGQGVVQIPFLNNIKLRLRFTGLQVNAAGQMIAGSITMIKDAALPFSHLLHPLGRIAGMTETEVRAMDAAMEGTGKLISLMTAGSETALPVGIDKTVEGTRINVGIVEMMFKPDSAAITAVVNIDLPNLEIVEGFISLGAEVCMTPAGLANDVRLFLPQDQVFDLGGGNFFVIKGAEGETRRDHITSVEWDCDGFKALNITGIHRFTRDWMLPEDERGNVRATGNVEARFTGRFTRGANIMINISMDPFQLPNMPGWGFTVARDAWIDLSDTENPEGLMTALPSDYRHPSRTAAGMQNSWKGFFLREVSVRTGEYLQGPDGNRLTFALRNVFIDGTGLTLSARVENILRWDGDGDMIGWKASLDTVYIDVQQNNFRRAGFNGKLGLPIADATQYMLYRAELANRDDNWCFMINISPAENIRIPVSMAQATIDRSTYVRAVIAERSYLEANLTATLSIGNSNLPSGQTMPSSVNMPGIRIQNLRINSETGFDNRDFAYSLTGMDGMSGPGRGGSSGGGSQYEDEYIPIYISAASTESTMSGFPIGLDHFSFSNDGITIKPRLTIAGGEGGFSAAAEILLHTDMEFVPNQRFNLTGVSLREINISVEASDVRLRGYLRFYKEATKEGVAGGINLELNMGQRIGIDINADFGSYKQPGALTFNRPDWYSYFYVDGTVYIGTGITIFSGLSIYGLSGGFYHHMRMTSTLPAGEDVLRNSGSRSGVTYEPHFATDLGLKFKVILGSNGDEGRAYNLDVGLQAEFSFTHGLTLLVLEGSFRVMTDGISIATIGREGNSPVAGYLRMELNLPPAESATFNGQFFVKVKVPANSPLLRGKGTIPNPPAGWTAENALVWAIFYVGPDKWFFHMGTPENRGGLSLTIGGVSVAEITGYMMIGHDIPVLIPEPHADFVRIFNNGQRMASDQGDVSILSAGRPRPPVPLGEGVAFGIAMALRLNAEFFPFYFALNSVMGCDINVTRSNERTCAGGSRVPGIDGWYGIGQFYAGIEGSFGIYINLFVEELRIEILKASAALLLRGGLPNPEWVSGRGSFYYNVCDGLAEGTCSFNLEAGEVCLPVTTGNPLGDITLIQDLKPDDGSEVEVYTEAAAAFSMQMNRIYSVEEYVSAVDPPRIRNLRPYIHSFAVRLNNSGPNIAGTGSWEEGNRVYNFIPNEWLRPRSSYTVSVEARISENGRDLMVRGTPFRETRSHSFRTKALPDRIPDQTIDFTYPYIRQQNFMKGETSGDFGYIALNRDNLPFFDMPGDVRDYEVYFTARFTSQDGQKTDRPIIFENRKRVVKFDVSHLNPDKLYAIQIIRGERPHRALNINDNVMSQVNASMANPSASIVTQRLTIRDLDAVLGSSTLRSNQYKRINLPAGQVQRFEKELYMYYFKTSRYHNFNEKWNAQRVPWPQEKITFGVDVVRFDTDLVENLEWTDIQEFKVVDHPRARTLPKMISFVARPPLDVEFETFIPGTLIPNTYLSTIVGPRIRGRHSQLTAIRNRVVSMINRDHGRDYNAVFPSVPAWEGWTPYSQAIIFSSASPFKIALDDGTIREAFTTYFNTGLDVSTLPGTGRLTLPVGFSGTRVPKTSILYNLHLTAHNQFRSLQRAIPAFAHTPVTYQTPIGNFTHSLYDRMNTAERNFVNSIPASNAIMETRFPKGQDYFGVQYNFPLPSGALTHRQIIHYSFMH